jgi:hypothetical protein
MQKIIPLFFILIFLLPSNQVFSQSGPFVSDVKLTYKFGTMISVNANVNSNQILSIVSIILQPDGQASRQVDLPVPENLAIQATFDLTKDYIRPFSRVYYWFSFKDSAGNITSSPSFWFDYLDDRFVWKSTKSNLFIVHWVDGDSAYGDQLQSIALDGLKKSTQILPVVPELPIRIFVYPGLDELQSAMSLTSQSWISGHASPEIGVILVSNENQTTNLSDMERQIPHELMHILQYQVTKDKFDNIPIWVSEGLAVNAEMYPNPDQQRLLENRFNQGLLLSLDSLCTAFSPDAEQAQLGYAQSASMTQFIATRFGSDVFPILLENSTSGLSCDQVVIKTLNLSMSELQEEWEIATFGEDTNSALPASLVALIILFSALMLAAVIAILIRSRNAKIPPGVD